MTSEIRLEILNDNSESKELNDFIENSVNGTLFHHPRFLSYHDKAKYAEPEYEIAHLLFRSKGKVSGFMPGMIQKSVDGHRFHSPCGASFGGLVIGDIGFDRCEKILQAGLKHLLEERKVLEINIAPATRIYMGDRPTDYLDYMYLSKGFKVAKCELTIATKVLHDSDFPRNVLEHRVRKFIAQAEKQDVTCKVSEDVGVSYSIIEESRKRFQKKPTHTADDLKAILRLFPGRIKQFVAYDGKDTPIAAACLFLCNKNVAYAFYIDQFVKHAMLRPVDYLIGEILSWSKKNDFLYLDFGPSTFGYEPHRSLIFFKEGFGGRGVMKYFYQYKA